MGRGDTMIFNKNFFNRKFFKTGPRCVEGSIWLGKNKTSALKQSGMDGKAEKCQKFLLRNRFHFFSILTSFSESLFQNFFRF